jgi:predicted ATPase
VAEHPGIERLVIRGFRCLKDVDMELSAIHALVGPNDSGKSTILEFVRGIARGKWTALAQADPKDLGNTNFCWVAGWGWRADLQTTDRTANFTLLSGLTEIPLPYRRSVDAARHLVSNVRLLRLDPDELRRPTGLIPHSGPLALGERGLGLASVLDAITSRDLPAFMKIREGFLTRFTAVRELGQVNISEGQKAVQIILQDGTKVTAGQMSEGMLYWLGFAVQQHLDPASILLVEEPENGLHPHRIQEVMSILRGLSESGTQVIIATHSPLVVNELQPHEVSVVTRTQEHGTRVTRLDHTKNFDSRRKVYEPGELWLAFADGSSEHELVGEG